MWIDTILTNFESKVRNNQIIIKHCPFCGNDNWNLEFSIEKEVGHCWICDFSSTAKRFLVLNGFSTEGEDWKVSRVSNKEKDSLILDSFIRLEYKQYPKFLSKKGIKEEDIDRYNLMIGTKGKYKDKLIIPLYEGNKLVYIVLRDLRDGGRYFNMDGVSKNVLPYYLGVNNKYRVYLCEGAFDAISINKLGYTSAILLGTVLTYEQIKKIKIFGFDETIICLDGDAKNKTIKAYDYAKQNGLNVKVVFMQDELDPNDLYVKGIANLIEIINYPKEVTIEDRAKCLIKKEER